MNISLHRIKVKSENRTLFERWLIGFYNKYKYSQSYKLTKNFTFQLHLHVPFVLLSHYNYVFTIIYFGSI